MAIKRHNEKLRPKEIMKGLMGGARIAYVGFSVVLIFILLGQLDMYAYFAGTSEAIVNFKNKDYGLYEYQMDKIPPEMESLITRSPRHVSRYDVGAKRLMESYNWQMITMYSHFVRTRGDEPNMIEQAIDSKELKIGTTESRATE